MPSDVDFLAFKAAKEAFVSDLGGTTKGEICLVVAAVPASLWLATELEVFLSRRRTLAAAAAAAASSSPSLSGGALLAQPAVARAGALTAGERGALELAVVVLPAVLCSTALPRAGLLDPPWAPRAPPRSRCSCAAPARGRRRGRW